MRPRFTRCLPIVAALLLLNPLSIARPAGASQADALPDPAGSRATYAPGDCLWDLSRALNDGSSMTCGLVTVPLFHDDPDGATIRLAVGVIEPERGEPRASRCSC